MTDQPCVTSAAPTTPDPSRGTAPESRRFLVRLSRTDCAEEPKKLIPLFSAMVLWAGFLRVADAAAREIIAGHGVDGSTQALLLFLSTAVAALAGYVHRMPEGGVQ